MVDPVTLATVTAAVANLGLEAGKQVLSDTGKHLWGKVKRALGWEKDPAPEELAESAAEKMKDRPELVKEVLALLKAESTQSVGQLVGKIDADKVVVAGEINTTNFSM
jgi:hypothetical protein